MCNVSLRIPQFLDNLRVDTNRASYYAITRADYISRSRPLSVSKGLFVSKSSEYKSVILDLSSRLEIPNRDVVAVNLSVVDDKVSICNNIAFWNDDFWLAETAVITNMGALFWPMSTFKDRIPRKYYNSLASGQRCDWIILFRPIG